MVADVLSHSNEIQDGLPSFPVPYGTRNIQMHPVGFCAEACAECEIRRESKSETIWVMGEYTASCAIRIRLGFQRYPVAVLQDAPVRTRPDPGSTSNLKIWLMMDAGSFLCICICVVSLTHDFFGKFQDTTKAEQAFLLQILP